MHHAEPNKERKYVARIDWNCFTLVVKCGLDAVETINLLDEKLMNRMAEPIQLMGKDIRVSFKAGVAVFPPDGDDADVLIRNAEAALRNAKTSRQPYLFYNVDMNARAEEKLSLENRLRQAIEQGQFLLHYQPKIDLTGGKMVGLEALIRWNEPGVGLVPPMDFIPIMEETGLIIEVGAWVIQQAHRQFGTWVALGLYPPKIAVNVSQPQMQQKNFVGRVRIRRSHCSIQNQIHRFDSLQPVVRLVTPISATIRINPFLFLTILCYLSRI